MRIPIICLLCKYNFVVLLCALQSALCSDQSHFSWFECYPKKDKVKNILIFFGYSAKTNKSQSFIVIYFNENESIKIYFKKSHIGIQSHFLWKETLGNLQTAPTPAKQLWFSLTFWPKQEKKENESDTKSRNNLHKYGVLIVLVVDTFRLRKVKVITLEFICTFCLVYNLYGPYGTCYLYLPPT